MSDNEQPRRSSLPPALASSDEESSSAPVVPAAARVVDNGSDTSGATPPAAAANPSPEPVVSRLFRAETLPFGSEEAPSNHAAVLAGLAATRRLEREAREHIEDLLDEARALRAQIPGFTPSRRTHHHHRDVHRPQVHVRATRRLRPAERFLSRASRQRTEREFRREFYRRPLDREEDESDSRSEGEDRGNGGRSGRREVELSYEGVLAMEREWDEVRGLIIGGEDEVGVVVDGEGEEWGVMNDRESRR